MSGPPVDGGRRALATIAVTFCLAFVLLQVGPGDPVDRLGDPGIPAEQAERTRRALGLDAPLHVRGWRTLRSYAVGELGVSFTRKRPVVDVLAEALPYSLLLGATALGLVYGAGLGIGWALLAAGPVSRRRAEGWALVVATLPVFWLSSLLVLVFHEHLGWLPASHAHPPGSAGVSARHLVLPAIALALPGVASLLRYLVRTTEEVRRRPSTLAARARGVGGRRFRRRYLLRPALAPVVALFALDLPLVVSGAAVVETAFSWPGLGRLVVVAVREGDYPLALASTVATSVVVVVAGQLARVGYAALDPRRRRTGTTGDER